MVTKRFILRNLQLLVALNLIELAGRHQLSLQWISWQNFGYIDFVKLKNNTYKVEGFQDGKKSKSECKNCYLKITGTIKKISDRALSFKGIIESSVSYIQQGKPYIKKGTFIFKATGNRKYWRCQNMKGCKESTDYIDIYFL